MQNKLVFNMGLKPVLKIEPPADRRAAQRETHRVRRAARARSEIAIYKVMERKRRGCQFIRSIYTNTSIIIVANEHQLL